MSATKYEPGTRISEYLLEACVGRGAFGEVWRARHHVWADERVAVKLPTDPQYVRYLQREGVVVHGLRHPNVIRVLGLDPYGEIPYLVMELVNGPALKDVIKEHANGVPIATAMTVLRGVLQGVAAAHEANVLHRDLKPGNVLLHLDGKPLASLTADAVKVSDFGFGVHGAEGLQAVAQSASIARDDQLVGTLAYMAPELRDGGQKADARSDLYSIGVMLFEMLTGERPAGAEMPSTIRAETPAMLDRVFQQLYARHERRFANARDVLALLSNQGGATGARRTAESAENVAFRPPPLPFERGAQATGRAVGDARHGALCPSCRRPSRAGDQFCTHCGEQIAPAVRRCRACNGFPAPHDRYCIFCGAVLAPQEV